MGRNRSATLVVVDGDGVVHGMLGPIAIDLPWWQEAGPIADAVAGATVLRLLSATADANEPMGGSVTYLVELDAEGLARHAPFQPWTGSLDDHPLRHPWAEPGGPAEDLAWVSSVVDVTGPPRQHRTWNLSAIWSVPTAGGPVWLKCLPPFFAHEIAVLEQLADQPIPRVIAADGHRCLMADLPGEDGYEADRSEQISMISTLVEIQRRSIDRVEDLLAASVPDLRTPRLIAELTELIQRLAPDSEQLMRLVDELPDRMAVVDRCGIPDGLVHGDPHGGNCRRGVDPPIWFDWGDSFIGNPLLDVAALHRMDAATVERWLDLWEEAIPGAEPRTAWRALEPIAALRMAWVYQRFLDNIEPNEHHYHRDDLPKALRDVERLLATQA